MAANPNEAARRYQRAERSRKRLIKQEQRVSAWIHGWSLLVLGAFLVKALWPADVPWAAVAGVAGGQTLLTWLIILTNQAKWRAVLRMKQAEDDALSGDQRA